MQKRIIQIYTVLPAGLCQVPSYVLMGISHGNASSKQMSLSPFGEACSRTDLTAIHEILEKAGYKDDEGVANEVGKFVYNLIF